MKKILLIEDEYGIRKNVGELLEMFEYTVATASNGEEGINLALNFVPDLIICDLTMRGLSGYDVFEKIKALDQFKQTPFIFLSARAEQAEINYAKSLGAEYQVKPFKALDLVEKIKNLL